MFSIGNVLSLFEGMGCGRLALDRIGVDYGNYYASEIDSSCLKVVRYNFPDTVQLGDVRGVKGSDLPEIDLLIGGSPCQGFSLAGRQLNFEDPQSILFFEFVRLLKECKPKWFLLENVKMAKESLDIITKCLRAYPLLINSSLVSAQNRERYYWTNIPVADVPKDRGLLIEDILEDAVPKKYFLSDVALKKIKRHGNGSWGNAKSNTIHAGYYKPGGRDQQYVLGAVTLRNRGLGKQPELGGTDKANCLTGVQSDSMVITHNLQPRSGKGKGGKGPLSKKDGKSYCLKPDTGQCIEKGLAIRRFTPLECERLQTVPDNFTLYGREESGKVVKMSDTSRYKMLGNGWTVDIISWIFRFIDEEFVLECISKKKEPTFKELNRLMNVSRN